MFSRREFLATTAVLAGSPWLGRAASSATPVLFAPQTGLFERSVGCDVAAQIERAAALGFRAFCDPQWRMRTANEREAVCAAALRFRLRLGPVMGPSMPAAISHLAGWRRELADVLSLTAAYGLPGVRFTVGPAVLGLDGDTLTEIWQTVGELAAARGQIALLEPWDDGRIGLWQMECCARLVRHINHPRLQLAVDSQQFQQAGAAWANYLRQNHARIGHVEMATFDEDVLSAVEQLVPSGYRGVVGLRMGWHLAPGLLAGVPSESNSIFN